MKKTIALFILTALSFSILNAQKTRDVVYVEANIDVNFSPNTTIIEENLIYKTKLVFESNGNLVLYKENNPIWSTNTANKGATAFRITKNGDLRVVGSGGAVLWSANSGNKNAYFLKFNTEENNYLTLHKKGNKGKDIAWQPEINFELTVKYDKEQGCGTFYKFGKELKKHCGWSKNWHTIVVVGCVANSIDNYKVLFYDQAAGIGEIYKVDKFGNMSLLQHHNGWSTGWSKISFIEWGICDGVIKFETADGFWEKYKCNDQGGISLHSKKE